MIIKMQNLRSNSILFIIIALLLRKGTLSFARA